MLGKRAIAKCPIGYCCQAMTGFLTSYCPNLETCSSLAPYHPLEFPDFNWEVEVANQNSPANQYSARLHQISVVGEVNCDD